MTSLLAFAPQHNSAGLHDASGAFRPEARSFVEAHEDKSPLLLVLDNHGTPKAMRDRQLEAIAKCEALSCVAFFCHGWKRGVQLAWTVDNVHVLAGALAERCTDALVVALYCCDTARDADTERDDDLEDGPGGEGGFADALRDALRGARPTWTGWVDGHTRVGHTTRCPDVRRCGADGTSEYLVARSSAQWKSWKAALRQTDLRFRYPFLARSDVRALFQP